MVKTKHQKSKPKKSPIVKKTGKQASLTQFRAYLDPLGLKIIQLTADGNCFFRGLADQLEGDEEEHGKYRSMVVQYIMKNREMFEPFIEDEIPFDEYCQSMETDGTWAGHMELQAASLVTHSNICIHKYMEPRWYTQNFKENGVRMIHLSYHDGEHYNSVRVKEDPCSGPAWPITIKVDANLSATSHEPKVLANKSKQGVVYDCVDSGSIKLVMAGSGCENSEKVKQVLLLVDGDVDAAVEFLIVEQQADDYTAGMEIFACDSYTSYECQGDSKDGNFEKHKEEFPKKKINEHGLSETSSSSTSQANDKNIPKNKVCPCGSKKKYKNCCGVGKGRSSIKPVGVQAIDSRKSKKETKQGKKGGPAKPGPSMAYDAGLPDMGALCI